MQRAAFLLIIGLLAGCLHGTDVPGPASSLSSTSPISTGPCLYGYYVGCDNNPDAQRMLAEYGLHQISNGTDEPIEMQVDSGLVSWMGGQYHAYDVSSGHEVVLPYESGWTPNAPQPSSCCIVYSSMPDTEGYPDSRLMFWNPSTGEHRQTPLTHGAPFVTAGGGFSGDWALLQVLSLTNQSGWFAANVADGSVHWLFKGGPKDNTYYGTPLVGQTISNGSVFLNFLDYEGEFVKSSRIIEYILDTGAEQEVLRLNDTALIRLDSSPRYLMATTGGGSSTIWIMDRSNRTWWNAQPNPTARAFGPNVGGDWCVYYEQVPPDDDKVWKGGLVGIHLPTGKRYELVAPGQDMVFESSETDGNYLVTAVNIGWATGNAVYPGEQLYWKKLPKI